VPASIDDYRAGRRFILCDLICAASTLISAPIVVIDVGAHDAFADPRWTKIPHDKIRLHGFEPDVQECAKLNTAAEEAGLDFHFYPIALAGETGQTEFYRYAEPAANSFYPPNEPLINRWCYGRSLPLASQFRLREKSSIQAVSLADWAKDNRIAEVDFIKLNVQGAELDVIAGAGPLLDSAAGMVVEQTFTPTYLGAPTFGKVYDLIEAAGFCMFDVVGMNRVARMHSPIHITEDMIFVVSGLWPNHQFFEGHFFYMRDPLRMGDAWDATQSPPLEKCFKMACIAEVFGQIEYAFEILEWIARSPAAGEVASETRRVIDDGAAIYRQASANPTPVIAGAARNVMAAMHPGSPPTAQERMSETVAGQASELARLRAELQAVTLQNARLQAGVTGMVIRVVDRIRERISRRPTKGC
jgi:FkbM family methyltransferase